MLIECLVERTGPTVIEKGKTRYTFMPIPRFDENGKQIAQTTSVCEVNSEEHVQYFLSRPQFREHSPRETPPAPKENPLARYSFEKHLDGTANAGYVVVDGKDKRFLGANGWQTDRKLLTPFSSEFEAFEALKLEVEVGEPEEDTGTDTGKRFACKTCGEACTSPRALGLHYKEKHPKG